MGEANNRQAEIEAIKAAAAERAAAQKNAEIMSREPAIFINGWSIAAPGNFFRLSLLEMPGGPIDARVRGTFLMDLATADALARNLMQSAAAIRAAAEAQEAATAPAADPAPAEGAVDEQPTEDADAMGADNLKRRGIPPAAPATDPQPV